MNTRYPWHKLVRPGDSFVWRWRKDERSLRSQAHKQGKRRGLVYTVELFLDGSHWRLRVTYVCGIIGAAGRESHEAALDTPTARPQRHPGGSAPDPR